jgi:transposase
MALHARDRFSVPEETAKVARAAFPKGNIYMTMRDKLALWYKDTEYAHLFTSHEGRPAESPGRLNLVMVMQYAEGLTDRQAADAVRARVDWKYALGLELTDPGFDYSILSTYRERIIAGGAEQQLLDDMLAQFKAQGLLKARGKQRTDSTHVVAAIRQLSRLECVGETLRAALDALAAAAPEWLLEQVGPDWFDRYGARFDQYRLPKAKVEFLALADDIGADGVHLLDAVYAADALAWLREVPAVEILRQVWIQQYYVHDGEVKWRVKEDLPPFDVLIQSPYDPEARNRTKRSTNWTGYTAHFTETCDAEGPNLITHVETTSATVSDVAVTDTIHAALADKDLVPREHFVDMGYIDADNLTAGAQEYGLDLYGPAPPDNSWQARDDTGFDVACFSVDWQGQTVMCPAGQTSRTWRVQQRGKHEVIRVHFDRRDCAICARRSRCTSSRDGPRTVTLRPQAQHEALQAARQRQTTPEFRNRYKTRAGVEGTISQGTRSFGLRRARYVGLAKTHLQHVLTAAAMDLTRAVAWLHEPLKAQTRVSRFAALAPAT